MAVIIKSRFETNSLIVATAKSKNQSKSLRLAIKVMFAGVEKNVEIRGRCFVTLPRESSHVIFLAFCLLLYCSDPPSGCSI